MGTDRRHTEAELAQWAEQYALDVHDRRRTLLECLMEYNALFGASRDTVLLARAINAKLAMWKRVGA